ncbi:MAG: O-antigen ligase family protein [Candidatus Doudnabacteria bacterium]|nr:O-antigen ligase family protein [Candidatus Doudnabacteria bacterium]
MLYIFLLSLLISPLYFIKINLLGIPGNFLMLGVLAVWLMFFLQLLKQNALGLFFQFVKKLFRENFFVGLFLLSGLISLFVQGEPIKNLGQFFVLFVQPVSLFVIGKYIFTDNLKKQKLINLIYFTVSVCGMYAIFQYFTNFGLPILFQGNDIELKRSVSFFLHPNFYALFIAPLLALLIPDLLLSTKTRTFPNLKILAWLFGITGLIFSFSRAGWLGIVGALTFYAIWTGDKKIRQTAAIVITIGIIIALATPSIKTKLFSPFTGEKSASSRITLWQSGIKAIKSSPIFGLGLGGYAKEYNNLISDKTLPPHNYPHNIFLNFWTETGLTGLISFTFFILFTLSKTLKSKNIIHTGVAMFLIAFLLQGQIDNPYFKNDLALVFWLIMSLV